MKTNRVAPFCVIAVMLCAVPSAWATWGARLSMGTTVVLSDPSCASPSTGVAVCAARGLGQTLMVDRFNGNHWSGWTMVAGVVTSNPSCTADGAGDVLCAARNGSGGISASVYDGSTWSTLIKAGGQITSAPSCALLRVGNVLCVGRSSAGGFTSSIYDGTSWSTFKTLAGSVVSDPGCGSDNTGGVVCIATTTTSWNVVAARFNGMTWTAFVNLGGNSTSNRYSCTPLGGPFGVLSCVARGTDQAVYVNDFKGGTWSVSSWSGWGSLGASANPVPSCAQSASSELGCAVVESDSALWVNSFNGSTWTGWITLGGNNMGNPACSELGNGKVLCAVVGLNGKASSTVGP
jgi:hypothetical protein